MIHKPQLPTRVKHFKSVRTEHSWRPVSNILIDIFLFAVGVLSSVVVHLVGDLFVAEILIILALPLLLAISGRRLRGLRLKRLFLLLGAWLSAQAVSDVYNHIGVADRMRGMALIAFFAIEIAFFAMILAGNEQRKAVFLTGYALGSVFLTRFQPNVAAIAILGPADRWKWSYAFGATILTTLVSCYFLSSGKRIVALSLLLGIAALDLMMNFRSAFLMILVTVVLVFPLIPERIGRLRLLPKKNNHLRIAIVVILALVGGWSANQLLHFVTQSGLIGEEAQQKNEAEAQAGNLLVGGRPEVFIGLRAAMDRPFIGHGSWAKEMKYLEMQHDMLQEFGIQHDLKDSEADTRGLIPTHSHLIGAWVFAGFVGAIFWAYLFLLVIKGLLVAAVERPSLAPAYVWLLVGYTWNIFFSPFGSTSRIIEAFTIVVILDLLDRMPHANSQLKKSRTSGWQRRPAFRPSVVRTPVH